MGFFSIDSNFFQSDFWLSERFSKPQAFIDLIFLANHHNKTISCNGVKYSLLRGQSARSIQTLAHRWGWDRKTVMRFLDRLEKDGSITQLRTPQTTIITIINYNELRMTKEPESEEKGQQKGQPMGHNIERVELLEPQTQKDSYSTQGVDRWKKYAKSEGYPEEFGVEFFEWNEKRGWKDHSGKPIKFKEVAARHFFATKKPSEPIPTPATLVPVQKRKEFSNIPTSQDVIEHGLMYGVHPGVSLRFHHDREVSGWNIDWREALKRINGIAA
jgi:DNA-binding MarR family transcriptional regulator